jgi:hypothetical protein
MLRRIAFIVAWCIVASALAPASHWGAGDRRYGEHVAGVARQGPLVERPGSRRDRDAGSQRMDSVVWLYDGPDRPLSDMNVAGPGHRSRSVTTLPSYHLSTHLSL